MSSQVPWVQVLWVKALRATHAETLTQKKRKQKAWAFCTALATHMDNRSGRVRISLARLSEDTGFSVDFLHDGLKASRELGLVHAKAMYQPGQMRREVSVYHARFPKGMQPDGYRRSGDAWSLDPAWHPPAADADSGDHPPAADAGSDDASASSGRASASSGRASASSGRILTKGLAQTRPGPEGQSEEESPGGDGSGAVANLEETPEPKYPCRDSCGGMVGREGARCHDCTRARNRPASGPTPAAPNTCPSCGWHQAFAATPTCGGCRWEYGAD